ncbi:pyridoxal phosphate-dependent decarboxylase family protein [Microvirga rosea]|uniref:pyridoxal phosphate-dependent decarboxylase family protein n=1 Tax=Microvirga rosea TaxID=2715425 RepID=UPI001D09FAAF|nr:pyridoxal-dependent decarboxylase [Microvirga rosea]MCB8820275.1 aspartate aminotransferase family protein [Microvirga rosea]
MPQPDHTADVLRQAAEHAINFRGAISGRLQRPEASYGTILARFEAETPEEGTAAATVVQDLVDLAQPGLHATTGPRFFGWVIGSSHPVGVAADWLTSAWGQNAANHTAAPAAAAAETVAARWLLDLLDLPREASVGFVTGATVANFVCLAAARKELLRRGGWDVEARGLFGAAPIQVLIGEDAHATVFSDLQLLGFGQEQVVRVATDDAGRILPSAFEKALGSGTGRGTGPTIAILQAGQLNTGAFDGFSELIPMAHEQRAWVHVDGAFGLWARACLEKRTLTAGVEAADSWATDGHKWLQTPYDCGYAIVRDADIHRRAMTIAASYLPPVSEGERDPSHFVPELSRRARGFATWAMIKHLGRTGIAAMVERHCRMARQMAEALSREAGIRVMNDVVINQIILRFGPDDSTDMGDKLTLETIGHLQAEGSCFMGGALWKGRWAMRISVISAATEQGDADRAVEAVRRAWRIVQAG